MSENAMQRDLWQFVCNSPEDVQPIWGRLIRDNGNLREIIHYGTLFFERKRAAHQIILALIRQRCHRQPENLLRATANIGAKPTRMNLR